MVAWLNIIYICISSLYLQHAQLVSNTGNTFICSTTLLSVIIGFIIIIIILILITLKTIIWFILYFSSHQHIIPPEQYYIWLDSLFLFCTAENITSPRRQSQTVCWRARSVFVWLPDIDTQTKLINDNSDLTELFLDDSQSSGNLMRVNLVSLTVSSWGKLRKAGLLSWPLFFQAVGSNNVYKDQQLKYYKCQVWDDIYKEKPWPNGLFLVNVKTRGPAFSAYFTSILSAFYEHQWPCADYVEMGPWAQTEMAPHSSKYRTPRLREFLFGLVVSIFDCFASLFGPLFS